MNILSIDTSGMVITVALSSGERIFSIEADMHLNDYESIISLIRSILKKAKLEIEGVDFFGVCVGPGSFTGIRIGLSTMKALAYSLNKPLIGFKSLDLIASAFKDEFKGLLCIIQDARRGNIYTASFRNLKGLRRVTPYSLIRVQELFKKLKEIHRKRFNLYFSGDAISAYEDQLKKSFPDSILLNCQDNNLGKIRAMILLTRNNLKQGCNPFKLLPFYMYPKDCQVRKAAK